MSETKKIQSDAKLTSKTWSNESIILLRKKLPRKKILLLKWQKNSRIFWMKPISLATKHDY
jgi:hypothetical protein